MESILILIGMIVLAYLANKGSSKKKKNVVVKLYKEYLHKKIDHFIYFEINEHRRNNGLNLLLFSHRQSDVAYSHSKWMTDNKTVNHNNMVERSENFENVYSEIIGYNFQNAEAFVDAWIASDKHNKKLLNNRATHIGIASEKDDQGRLYVTVNFLELGKVYRQSSDQKK